MFPSPSQIARRHDRAAHIRRRRLIALIGAFAAVAALAAAAVHASESGTQSVNAKDFTDNRTLSAAREVHERFHSNLLHRNLDEIVLLPKGYSPTQHRPLLVLLHGHGSTPQSMDNHWLTDPLSHEGAMAPVVLLANGGDDSYDHDRRDGPWGTSILRELIPQTEHRYGLSSKLALGGISMGGFGALDLTRLEGRRICATGAMAPAIFTSASVTAPGAFDDAQDYARHDLLHSASTDHTIFHGTPVYLGGGDQDPFHAETSDLAADLRPSTSHVIRVGGAGGHDGTYWNPRMNRYIGWYASQLAHCSGAA